MFGEVLHGDCRRGSDAPGFEVTTLIQYIRRIARPQGLECATDAQLLSSFAATRDEAAFALLVQRHGSMVLGVCRRMLGDTPDAEDAFQAAFLVLVRKATSIHAPELLANWLYGVALRAAAKARAVAAKRHMREAQLDADLADRAPSSEAAGELRSILDEEIGRLPQKYRVPFILCYLNGASNEDAARRLGCPKGTVQSRLSWARHRLRHRLTRRGFALSTVVLASELLAGEASAGVAATLANSTIKAALHYASGQALGTGVISASVATLTQGVLHTMFMIKVKTIAAAIVILILIGAAGGVVARANLAASPALPAASATPATDKNPPAPEQEIALAEREEEKRTGSKSVAREIVSKSFKTGNKPVVNLEVFNGGIDVVAGEENKVEIQITKESRALSEDRAKEALAHIQVTASQDGDAISVQAKKDNEARSSDQLSAAAKVRVPPGAALTLNTSNGPVTVKGGTGTAQIRTSNGAISVKDRTGPLHSHTSNGAIEVVGGKELLELHTSNGPMHILANGAKVDARTSNGTIEFKGKLNEGKHTFHSSNGSIALALPSDSQFKIDAATSHGRISTGFKVESSGKVGKTHLQGKVGSEPGISLELRTSNGNIAVNSLSHSD
jgi:RNA polymerase sigma factor (sigma-70 family)